MFLVETGRNQAVLHCAALGFSYLPSMERLPKHCLEPDDSHWK